MRILICYKFKYNFLKRSPPSRRQGRLIVGEKVTSHLETRSPPSGSKGELGFMPLTCQVTDSIFGQAFWKVGHLVWIVTMV